LPAIAIAIRLLAIGIYQKLTERRRWQAPRGPAPWLPFGEGFGPQRRSVGGRQASAGYLVNAGQETLTVGSRKDPDPAGWRAPAALLLRRWRRWRHIVAASSEDVLLPAFEEGIGDLDEMRLLRPDLVRRDYFAKRAGHAVAAGIERLPDGEVSRKSLGLGWRHADDGTALEQHAVEIAAPIVQLSLDATLVFQPLRRARRAHVGNRHAGRVIGDRFGGHHRRNADLRPLDCHGVAGANGEHELG